MARRRAPFLRRVKAEHPDKTIEVWTHDEARVGQQGTLTNAWAPKGSRPAIVRQTEYEWLYVWAAVNPVTGESCAILTPTVCTELMNQHLKFISTQVGPTRHVVLILDRAGWHIAKALAVPANITLLHLPPYSPELNPTERVWACLRSHYLSNRIYKNYDVLFDHCKTSWNRLEENTLASITHTDWITHEIQG